MYLAILSDHTYDCYQDIVSYLHTIIFVSTLLTIIHYCRRHNQHSVFDHEDTICCCFAQILKVLQISSTFDEVLELTDTQGRFDNLSGTLCDRHITSLDRRIHPQLLRFPESDCR